MTEHLEIPAAQWTNTFVCFLFYSIKLNAGLKTWVTFWSCESLKSNVIFSNPYGYLWCKFTPDTIAFILFSYNFLLSCAKENPLIQIYPN